MNRSVHVEGWRQHTGSRAWLAEVTNVDLGPWGPSILGLQLMSCVWRRIYGLGLRLHNMQGLVTLVVREAMVQGCKDDCCLCSGCLWSQGIRGSGLGLVARRKFRVERSSDVSRSLGTSVSL